MLKMGSANRQNGVNLARAEFDAALSSYSSVSLNDFFKSKLNK